jgi:hypothetical protein
LPSEILIPTGICPNADVAGVGVRAAFYLNSIMTAALVALSPADSPGAGIVSISSFPFNFYLSAAQLGLPQSSLQP